jgi:hypothetical protein
MLQSGISLAQSWLIIALPYAKQEDAMYRSLEFQKVIERMFIPPVDYDSIKVETRETPEEPVLIVTLYKDSLVVFFHNYAYESTFLDETAPAGFPGLEVIS